MNVAATLPRAAPPTHLGCLPVGLATCEGLVHQHSICRLQDSNSLAQSFCCQTTCSSNGVRRMQQQQTQLDQHLEHFCEAVANPRAGELLLRLPTAPCQCCIYIFTENRASASSGHLISRVSSSLVQRRLTPVGSCGRPLVANSPAQFTPGLMSLAPGTSVTRCCSASATSSRLLSSSQMLSSG